MSNITQKSKTIYILHRVWGNKLTDAHVIDRYLHAKLRLANEINTSLFYEKHIMRAASKITSNVTISILKPDLNYPLNLLINCILICLIFNHINICTFLFF